MVSENNMYSEQGFAFQCRSSRYSEIVQEMIVESRGGFKVRETVSQLGPADTVTGCAPVMSAHEKKGGATGKNIPET